jgi:hypothetical protein
MWGQGCEHSNPEVECRLIFKRVLELVGLNVGAGLGCLHPYS